MATLPPGLLLHFHSRRCKMPCGGAQKHPLHWTFRISMGSAGLGIFWSLWSFHLLPPKAALLSACVTTRSCSPAQQRCVTDDTDRRCALKNVLWTGAGESNTARASCMCLLCPSTQRRPRGPLCLGPRHPALGAVARVSAACVHPHWWNWGIYSVLVGMGLGN